MQRSLLFMTTLMLCVILMLFAMQNHSDAATGLTQSKWEYAVYQVKVGNYEFEWIDNNQYIYGDSQESFFYKLGLQNTLVKIENKYAQRHPLSVSLFNIAYLNYLADQGWELIDTWGNYKESVHVYTLRRSRR